MLSTACRLMPCLSIPKTDLLLILKDIRPHALLAGWVALALLAHHSTANAADGNIYPTNHATTPWTFEEVNRYLDPTQCAEDGGGPYGTPCPIAGDTIILSGHGLLPEDQGVFTPPALSGGYQLKTNNVHFTCANAVVRGSQEHSQTLLFTDSGGITIYGCTFEGAPGSTQWGIISRGGFGPANPVIVTGNTFTNLDVAVKWNSISAPTRSIHPGVKYEGNHIRNTVLGAQFNAPGGDETTFHAIFAGNTVEGTGALAFGPLYYPNATKGAKAELTVPGLDQFDGNIFINYDGVPLPQDIMSDQGFRTGTIDTPGNNMEFAIAQNPDPSNPFVAYLEAVWPGAGNISGDTAIGAGLNWARRPLPGSPAIPRKAGAFTPVYDTGERNGTWEVTRLEDFAGAKGFRKAFNDSNAETLSTTLQSIHDIDGDGYVDWHDFTNETTGGFLQACADCALLDCNENGLNDLEEILAGDIAGYDVDWNDNTLLNECGDPSPPDIPSVSEWGVVVMFLLLLVAGTILLSSSRQHAAWPTESGRVAHLLWRWVTR